MEEAVAGKTDRALTTPAPAGVGTKAVTVETARANSPAVARGDAAICRVNKSHMRVEQLWNPRLPNDVPMGISVTVIDRA